MSAAVAWDETLAPARVPGRPHLRLVPTVDAAARPVARRLRLTRRGRLTMTLTVAVLVAVAAFSTWSALASVAPVHTAPHSVTVTSGETLSEVAARELPGEPVDQGVVTLVETNHLANDQVAAGQVLVVPGR